MHKHSEPLRDFACLLARVWCLVSVRAISHASSDRRWRLGLRPRAILNGTPARGLAASASFAPSAYAYTPSGASPAESAHALKQSVPLAAAKSPAHGTFWPWGLQSRPHPSLRAEACDLPRHPQPIRVALLRRGIPRHCHARASARLTRTGRSPPPSARSSASPSDPDPRSGGVCPFAAFARSRLRRNRLARLPDSRCCTVF